MAKGKLNIVIKMFITLLIVCFFSFDAYAGKVASGCRPLPERIAENESCFLCPLFAIILKTDQTMATNSYNTLASPFKNLTIVLLALFIAYHTLLLVSGFTKQDAPKYLNTLLIQAFKVLLVVLLLSNSDHIYKYAINPIMTAGLEFGLALLHSSGEGVLQELQSLTAESKASMPEGVIEKDLLATVMGAIKLFNKAAGRVPAIGSMLTCISVNEGTKFLINFEMWFQGLVLMGFGWAIAFSSCFYLLDSVVRFGIFCTLLPFLIAMWPYEVTTKYTKTGWDIFMNVFFNFVMMGLIITLTSELIVQAATGGSGGVEELEKAINGDSVEKLRKMMDIGGLEFIILIATCMFAFKLVGQIGHLAAEVSGTDGGTNIGGKMGGQAAQAAKKIAQTAVKGAKLAASGGTAAAGMAADASMDAAQKGKQDDTKELKD